MTVPKVLVFRFHPRLLQTDRKENVFKYRYVVTENH